MTLEELLAELAKLDRTQVVEGIQKSAQPIFQAIYDRGVGFANAKWGPEKTALEGQVASLTSEKQTLETRVRTIEEKTPDLAAERQKFDAQIQAEQQKYEAKLKAAQVQLQAERKSRAVADLKAKLIAAGVDSDYADVMTLKPDVQKRINFTDAGTMQVLQANSDIPFAAAGERTGIDLLADELKTGVPAKFLLVNSDAGSGTEGTGNGAGGAAGAAKNLFKDIRKQAKDKQEAAVKAPTAAERLGMRER
jgi:hypothetical protein